MTWYQDRGESYNYEDLHRPEETHQPSPEKKPNKCIRHRLEKTQFLPNDQQKCKPYNASNKQ